MKAAEVDEQICEEVTHASAVYGHFASAHEALGVLVEEMAELTAAVHQNDLDQVTIEAMQVAAVATRLAYSMANEPTRRRSLGR